LESFYPLDGILGSFGWGLDFVPMEYLELSDDV